jgi:hypothetical protein
MRATAPARLAAVALAASSSLILLTGPAHAAGTTTPTRVGNDGVKTFSVTGGAPYYDTDHEAVALKATTPADAAPVPGTVTGTGTCSGITIPLISNASCTGPLTFTADTTNLPSGTYTVMETRTDATKSSDADTTAAAGTVTVFAQPVFAASEALTPSALGQRAKVTVTVKGTGFAPGMTASFGNGTTVSALAVSSPTQLTVDVEVAAGATPGTRDVVLTSPDEGVTPGVKATATLPGGFTVNPAPTVTSVSPASVTVGAGTVQVTITGTGFVAGPEFLVTVPGATVTNAAVTNATTAKADVTPNANAVAGKRAVFVTNPDGGNGSLADAFTIVAPPQPPTGLKAVAGDGSAFLSWNAPVNTGSGPITSYRVTATQGVASPVVVTGRSALVTGLTNGTTYTFVVAAKNSAVEAYGSPSDGATVTPKYAVTLTVKPSATTRVAGQAASASGRLTRTSSGLGVAGATLKIRYAPAKGFPITHTVTTAGDGTWKDAGITFTYNTVVTGLYAGSPLLAAKQMSTAVGVAPKVGVASPKSGASSRVRAPLVVTGTITPNKAGQTVYVFRVSGGKVTLLAKGVVSSKGTYALRAALATRGTYALKVSVVAGNGNTAGSSALFTVKRV